MTTAAKITLSMVFCAALSLTAQVVTPPDAVQLAGEEAVRREERTIELHQKLAQAQEAQSKDRLVEAARLYQEAATLIPDVQIGNPTVEADKKAVVLGLDDVRIKLAHQALTGGDLAGASDQVKAALKVDPTNPALLQLKAEVDRMTVEAMGRTPSPDLVKAIPAYEKQKLDIGTQLQNAKLLYEMEKWDEAETILKNVLKEDPANKTAVYYTDLIAEARFAAKARARETTNKKAILAVENSWVPSTKRESLPQPNPMADTNLVYTSRGRQAILEKLDRIHLDEVQYDLPLTEVLKQLAAESIKHDPDGVGINFMIDSHAISTGNLVAPSDITGGAGGGRFGGLAPAQAPQTVTAVTPAPAVDMTQVTIHLSPALRNMRLADVLDAICKVADQPITYVVEDYAVMFAPKPPLEEVLYSRIFHVDPNTFVQGLQNVTGTPFVPPQITAGTGGGAGGGGSTGQQNNPTVTFPGVQVAPLVQGASQGGGGGGGGLQQGGAGQQIGLRFVTITNNTESLNDLVRDYFTAAGVNLAEPGKSVFFNDRNGLLMVRASEEDLEIIAEAIETLNQSPKELRIEAKFAELSQEDTAALGFNWLWGNTLLNNGAIGVQGGTAPSYTQPGGSAANPSGIFPGPGGVGAILPIGSSGTGSAQGTDNNLTSGLRNVYGPINSQASIPTVATITGIMTDPQFRVAINAIEQRTGVDVLSAPEVTTLSGRQAHISAEEIQEIVTGVTIQTTGTAVTGTLGGSGTGVAVPTVGYTPTPFAFGPVLDVMPTVSADGYSIQMAIIPTLTEFVGYDNPGGFVPQAQGAAGSTLGVPLTAVLPLPHWRVREVVTTCNVWDGQTVVLGGMIAENITKTKDKVPVLGDLPLLGRLFTSQSSDSTKQNLLIFVTPTMIDPAGNRVHTDADLPFAKTTIPPQPPTQ